MCSSWLELLTPRFECTCQSIQESDSPFGAGASNLNATVTWSYGAGHIIIVGFGLS